MADFHAYNCAVLAALATHHGVACASELQHTHIGYAFKAGVAPGRAARIIAGL